VAELGGEIGHHRVEHAWIERRRGVVVHVDGKLQHRVASKARNQSGPDESIISGPCRRQGGTLRAGGAVVRVAGALWRGRRMTKREWIVRIVLGAAAAALLVGLPGGLTRGGGPGTALSGRLGRARGAGGGHLRLPF